MFPPLPDDLAAALAAATERLGPFGAVHYLPDVDSTNDVALALVASGAAEGTSVLADSQRRGRGRRGHEWFSPANAGIYLSVIVRSSSAAEVPPLLTLGAGVALADAVIGVTGLPVELKWPNDVVIGRPWRKLGGVLAEGVSSGERSAVVVGLGLNVGRVALPADLRDRASSLETELCKDVDRLSIVVDVLSRLREVVSRIRAGRHAEVLERWRALAAGGLGGAVRWRDSHGEHRGIASGVDSHGALLVRSGAAVETVIAGDVTWEEHRRG